MQAQVYDPKLKDSAYLSIQEISKPQLSENNLIVKVRGCGVCGSDLLKLERGLVNEGSVLGHELVGEVHEISEPMAQKYKLQKGDRIISSHHVPCLKCDYCLNQQESLCQQFKATNFKPGAFCEFTELSELHMQHTVQKIPDNLSDEEASFTEPIACCIKAIKRSKLLSHKGKAKSIVIGLGSIGQIIGQLVQHYSSSELIGCDLEESKLKLAQKHGFKETKTMLENENADFIFLCAGAAATIDMAIKNIKPGGTIVVFSSVADKEKAFTNNDIYYKELTIMGSYSPNLEDLRDSLELLSAAKIKVKDLITHRANLDTLGEEILRCREEKGLKTYLELSPTTPYTQENY